jgi:antitoxin (DNA-binding transcriptional repressor) of toxin-antitoxin stability system
MYTDVQYVQYKSGGLYVKTISFTEFRQHASGVLGEVEKGERFLVLRHGKPVAELSPPSVGPGAAPSWKRPGLRLTAKGASLSSAILEERRRANVL